VKEKMSMSEEKLVYKPSDAVKMKATIRRMEDYKELYQRSLNDPEKFWGELAEQLDWSSDDRPSLQIQPLQYGLSDQSQTVRPLRSLPFLLFELRQE